MLTSGEMRLQKLSVTFIVIMMNTETPLLTGLSLQTHDYNSIFKSAVVTYKSCNCNVICP